ncbi:MAG: hypothetical protein ACFCBU_02895, partial [Cyanophyceae cyanobacterium]
MSNSVPPGSSNSNPNEETNLVPTSRQSRPVETEECWAIVIAILAMAGIFWWTTGRNQFSMDLLSSVTGDSAADVTGGAPTQSFNGGNGNGGTQNNANGGLLDGVGAVESGVRLGDGNPNDGGNGGDGAAVGGAAGNGDAARGGNGKDCERGDRRNAASETYSVRGDVPPPPTEAIDPDVSPEGA